MKKRILFCCFWLFFSLLGISSAFTQSQIVGKVVDLKGNPIPGVNIVEKGTMNGVITNLDGNYSIDVTDGSAVLKFSFIGFEETEIPVQNRTIINVTLEEALSELDEVVVVGYGTQKKISVTGAISTLSDGELMKAPTVGITNVIGSRVAGVSMLQTSGQPGGDAASLLIRGKNAVYIVDGVERAFNEIDPNEIESVSVLKDATSAAVYGLDASAAVIVTTKRGKAGKMNITYSGKYGISENASQLEWLDGPGYAYWYNKSREMDGDAPVFTADQVQKMKDGVDGWGNTNWYDKVFGVGSTQHHNLSATGGSEKVRFFTSVGAFSQKGNVDLHNFDRFNLRSNVDAKITDNLSLELGIAGRVEKRENPRYTANPNDWHNIPQQAVRALPYIPETMTHEGKEYYTSTRTASSPVSPLAAINESGYGRSRNTYIQSNLSLKYDVPGIEGLNLKFMGAYDKFFQFAKNLAIPFETMLASLQIQILRLLVITSLVIMEVIHP